MDKEHDMKKKNIAMEKARLKAEYKRIMNERQPANSGKGVGKEGKEGKGITTSSSSSSSLSSSSSSSSVSNKSTKRKRELKGKNEDIEAGMRVKSRFDSGDSYEGSVTNIKRGKGGGVSKISIQYDDGDEEECSWPEDDIVIIGRREVVGENGATSVMNGRGDEGGGKGERNIEVEIEVSEEKGVKMFTCGENGCEYKSKWKHHLKNHKANIHYIDVVFYPCNAKGCIYESRQVSALKAHKANIHDIDVVYFSCSKCDYAAKNAAHLKRHKATIHDIDVVYYPCSKCDYEAKEAGALKKHKAMIHDIDVVYYPCSKCDYEAKTASNLKKHKAFVHDIDVVYYPCNKCDYEAKRHPDLRSHKARIHGIVEPPKGRV